MELEDLKKNWNDLNDRLDRTDERLRALTCKAVRERADDLRRRTERRLWLPLVAAGMLPLLFYNLNRMTDWTLGTPFAVSLALFVIVSVADSIALLVRLHDIDPVRSTVSEICRRTRALRRHLLWGFAVQFTLMLVLILLLITDLEQSNLPDVEYMMYGFWFGLAVGLPIGIRRFMKIYGDVVEMERTFGDAEE